MLSKSNFNAWLVIAAAAVLTIVVIATAVNLVLISNRPETISVVNALIGQGVVLLFLTPTAHSFYRIGFRALKSEDPAQQPSTTVIRISWAAIVIGTLVLLLALIPAIFS